MGSCSSIAMPILVIGLLMVTSGGVESGATDPSQSYNGVQVEGAQEECSAAYVKGRECIAGVFRVFRGGAEQTSPVCCSMMMEMTQICRLVIFPDPNIFPTFKSYCAARYGGGGGGSDTAPGAAGPAAPAPVGL